MIQIIENSVIGIISDINFLCLYHVWNHLRQETCHESPYIRIRGFDEQILYHWVVCDHLLESCRIYPQYSVQHVEEILKRWRLEPKSKCEFLAQWQNLFVKIVGETYEFRKEFSKRSRWQAFLIKVDLIISLHFISQCLGNVWRNWVLNPND